MKNRIALLVKLLNLEDDDGYDDSPEQDNDDQQYDDDPPAADPVSAVGPGGKCRVDEDLNLVNICILCSVCLLIYVFYFAMVMRRHRRRLQGQTRKLLVAYMAVMFLNVFFLALVYSMNQGETEENKKQLFF